MTDDRSFDRLARAWLELGPKEAPDRAVSAVLEAVETTPQVRRRVRWAISWPHQTNRLPVLVTIWVVMVLAIVGAGLFLTRGDQQPVSQPTSSPFASPTTAADAGVPGGLRMVRPDGSFPALAVWMTGPRSLAGQTSKSGTALRFTEGTLALARSNSIDNPLMVTSATGTADGGLRLTTSPSCLDGAVGAYRWSLSADGRQLTITATSDACTARLSAVPGTWQKIDCKDPMQPCLGDLAAGTYPSLNFDPHLKTVDTSTAVYGAVTYTVPDGWANAADWPGELVLVPSADYADYGQDGAPGDSINEVVLAANVVMSDQTASCKGLEVTTIEHSVQGFIDWLRAQRRIVASEPNSITVDGYSGQWIDVRVAPTWTNTCPDFQRGTPAAVILTPAKGVAVPAIRTGNDATWPLVGDEEMRLVFVDIGRGDIALIWVDAPNPERFGQLVPAAMPIIESMTFK